MFDPLIAIVLGIVEGITEFLPISSTGHLLITEHFGPGWKQSDLFNIVIQCGAVIAVLPLFQNRLRQFTKALTNPAARDYALQVLLAFVITGAGGFLMEKKGFKLTENVHHIAWALLLGGVAFLAIEFWLRGRKANDQITWAIAVAVGFGQLVAAYFPGSSRSGTTIILCLILGLSRIAATEFCFLVGIPTMLAAGGYKIFKAFHHPVPGTPPENWTMVIVATLIAAVVSFVAVKWLLHYVQSHTFQAFGYYRIVVGVALLVLFHDQPATPPKQGARPIPALAALDRLP